MEKFSHGGISYNRCLSLTIKCICNSLPRFSDVMTSCGYANFADVLGNPVRPNYSASDSRRAQMADADPQDVVAEHANGHRRAAPQSGRRAGRTHHGVSRTEPAARCVTVQTLGGDVRRDSPPHRGRQRRRRSDRPRRTTHLHRSKRARPELPE